LKVPRLVYSQGSHDPLVDARKESVQGSPSAANRNESNGDEGGWPIRFAVALVCSPLRTVRRVLPGNAKVLAATFGGVNLPASQFI
jgi:hypothetical protein